MAIKLIDWLLRRDREEPEIPDCPDHDVQMRLRGMMGRPARFSRQTEEQYTHIYFCPVEGCNQTAERQIAESQTPVPGEPHDRPSYARSQDARPRP